MFPKKGKNLPVNGRSSKEDARHAVAIGLALRMELGGSHQSIKTIMKWTTANERTIKNWLAGANGPRNEHLIDVIRHSDAVCSLVLRLAGRDQALASVRLSELRCRLVAALAELDGPGDRN